MNSKPALLLGIHYKIYSRGDADQEEPSQELRRTTKAKLGYPPIIDAQKLPQVTPKCNSRRKCMREPVHSKSNAPVCARESHAKREPSLTVSLADISVMA